MELNGFWGIHLFGTTMYHLGVSFVIYSILGWFVESVYMSICNKKLTNRGIAKGPFCPIYGVGATVGSLLLNPFSGSYFLVYIIGAVLATSFEFITGLLMMKFLGSLWWDYDNKPYNYKGIICLESTIAWGFYAIGVVKFLNGFIFGKVEKIETSKMVIFVQVVLAIALVDYIFKGISIAKGTASGEKKAV